MFARVDLEPLLEPEHGGVFVHVGPEPLLDGFHSCAIRLVAFWLTLNLTHSAGAGWHCATVYSSYGEPRADLEIHLEEAPWLQAAAALYERPHPGARGWARSCYRAGSGRLGRRQVGSCLRPRAAVARGVDHALYRFPPLRQGARTAQPWGTPRGSVLLGRVGDSRGDDLPWERSRTWGDSVGRRIRLAVLRRAQVPLRARHRQDLPPRFRTDSCSSGRR